MTEAKHLFTIEITSDVIEPFTSGNSFLGTGHVGRMVQVVYKRVLVLKYKCISMATTNATNVFFNFIELEHAAFMPQI